MRRAACLLICTSVSAEWESRHRHAGASVKLIKQNYPILPAAHLQPVGLNDLHELGADGVGVEGIPASGSASVASRSSSAVLAWEAPGLHPGLAAWSSVPARLLSSAVLAWEASGLAAWHSISARLLSSAVLAWEASRLSILTRSAWQPDISIIQYSCVSPLNGSGSL